MNDNDADLFKDVVWLCKATGEEQFNLWQHFAHNSDSRLYKEGGKYPPVSIKWEQRNPGCSVRIGTVDGRPINVGVSYAYLNGHLVVFYEGLSQLVDWAMIDSWIRHYAEKCLGWELKSEIPGRAADTWPHCDAANFTNCFRKIGVRIPSTAYGCPK